MLACWVRHLRLAKLSNMILGKARSAYLVPAIGSVSVNGVTLATRDGAAIQDEDKLTINALEDSEILMVDARS